MGLSPGGALPPHSTENPISIHVLRGEVTFFALDNEYALAAGDVLMLGAGVEHAARSRSGATFLLTVAYTFSGEPETARRSAAAPDRALSETAKQRWLDDGGKS
jgi:quercetin dioxygenase-like cupin family protein